MMSAIIFVFSLILSLALGSLNLFIVRRGQRGSSSQTEVEAAASSLRDLTARFEAIQQSIVKAEMALPLTREIRSLENEINKKSVEVSVASSELEAIGGRLQELEEIRREVEASAEEIKQELQSLHERESELLFRRQELESQLEASRERMFSISSELAMSEEMQAQIERMQSELSGTQEQCDKLLVQIQRGNQQCMVMKQRYNALDIEYALLYERFSKLEESRAEG